MNNRGTKAYVATAKSIPQRLKPQYKRSAHVGPKGPPPGYPEIPEPACFAKSYAAAEAPAS